MIDDPRPNEPVFGPAVTPPPTPAPAAVAPTIDPRVVEDFARAYLKDRRSERRWRVFFRFAWLGLLLLVLWAIAAQQRLGSAPSGPHTALIDVRGEIAEDALSSADVLDGEREFIVCSIHGAHYHPASGRCAGGPCGRGHLTEIAVSESDGEVRWYPSRDIRPALRD